VAKIAQPWLLSEGVRPALLVQDLAEAMEYRARLGDRSAAMVVQDFIPDEAAEDWFYHGYHAAGGEPVVGFTGRKLRSYPPFVGATSYGISLVNKKVRSLAQSLLLELRYAGIVELEFRLDKRDGQYKLIDFNPRLGAQFQFLRNSKGVDVVRALHLDISGRPVPCAPQVEGNTFVSDFTDMAVFRAYWRRGLLSPTDWLKQMLGADEHAWFAVDDLAPFAAASLRFGARFFGRMSPRREASEKIPQSARGGI
jgi:predicted ATP-grasp superfamily ATP-dependent carboligase